MTWSKVTASIAMGAAILGGAAGLAQAQVPPAGRTFVLHSEANGNCPSLDWHVQTGANNSLFGFVAWNNMQNIARVNGTIRPDRSFNMTALEVGQRQRKVTITGQVAGNGNLTASISGSGVNCPNITIPVYNPAPSGAGG